MGQYRFWNFLADPETEKINSWLLGIFEPGVYRGFDKKAAAGANLVLEHLQTGIRKVKVDGTQTPFTGIIVTNQGPVITEDADISIPIAPNASGNPRIDTIFLQHEIVEIENGAAATYGYVQGAPGVNPVAPALTFPLKQIKIGELLVPAGVSDMANATFTKSPIPFLGNHIDNFAYTDKKNIFALLQTFTEYRYGDWNDTVLDDSAGEILLPQPGNLYRITEAMEGAGLNFIEPKSEGFPLFLHNAEGGTIYISDGLTNIVKPVNNSVNTFIIEKGDTAMFIGKGAGAGFNWVLVNIFSGGTARLAKVNSFSAQQRLGKSATAAVLNFAAGGVNSLYFDDKGNFFSFAAAANGTSSISFLKSKNPGTEITFYITNDCTIYNNGAATPAGYKPVYVSSGGIRIKSGSMVTFREDATLWRLESVCPVSLRQFNRQTYTLF